MFVIYEAKIPNIPLNIRICHFTSLLCFISQHGFGLLVIQNKEFEHITFCYGNYNRESETWGFMESKNCFEPDAMRPDWQSTHTRALLKVMNFFLGNFISLFDYLFSPSELVTWRLEGEAQNNRGEHLRMNDENAFFFPPPRCYLVMWND